MTPSELQALCDAHPDYPAYKAYCESFYAKAAFENGMTVREWKDHLEKQHKKMMAADTHRI